MENVKNYQEKFDRKKAISEFLEKINFPKEIITENIFKEFEEIIYNYEDKCKIFKNFSKKNIYNRKFFLNMINENENFNIKPLFKYYCDNKENKNKNEFFLYANLLYKEILIKRMFVEKIILNNSYFDYFKLIGDFFYEKNIDLEVLQKGNLVFFQNIHDITTEAPVITSFKNFINLIISEVKEYKRIFEKIPDESIFKYSSINLKLNSLHDLFFTFIPLIDKEMKLNNEYKNHRNEILFNNILELPVKKFEKYNNEKDTVMAYLDSYQLFKIYSEDRILNNLINEKSLEFYENFKIPPRTIFRLNGIKKYTKKELYEQISRNTNYSNFIRAIADYEKFININNLFSINPIQKENLKDYGLCFQELLEHKEDFNGKRSSLIIKALIKEKNVSQSEREFLKYKIERAKFFGERKTKEQYIEMIELKKVLRNFVARNSFDHTGKNYFEAIIKYLEYFKDNSIIPYVKCGKVGLLPEKIKYEPPYQNIK